MGEAFEIIGGMRMVLYSCLVSTPPFNKLKTNVLSDLHKRRMFLPEDC